MPIFELKEEIVPVDYNSLVAANLRRYRKKAGLTQSKLAMQADISPQHLSKIERMDSSPTVKTLVALCDCLKISPKVLFDSTDLDGLMHLYADLDDSDKG